MCVEKYILCVCVSLPGLLLLLLLELCPLAVVGLELLLVVVAELALLHHQDNTPTTTSSIRTLMLDTKHGGYSLTMAQNTQALSSQ